MANVLPALVSDTRYEQIKIGRAIKYCLSLYIIPII